MLDPSIEAAKILHDHGLDGRSIEGTSLKASRMWVRGLAGILLMVLSAPVTIPSTGIQAFFAWYMGDRTDEGIDARTTYHFLAGMFSPVIFWIPIAIATSMVLISPTVDSFPINLVIAASIVILIHASNLVFLLGYDYWIDFSNSAKSTRLASSEQGNRLIRLIDDMSTNLNLL